MTAAEASWAASVHHQLLERNRQHVDAFGSMVADYLAALHRAHELQVRNAQLDKEAGELRLENDTLVRGLEDARQAAVQGAELAAAQDQAQRLQAELTAAYKEKSGLAEESLQATRQLQVVRDINERQARELADAAAEIKRLKEGAKELRGQVEHWQGAHALVSSEVAARLAEAQQASGATASLEQENAELVKRLIEMKTGEIERMNEMNRMREEMLASARQEAAGILAEARTKLLRARPSEGAEILEASMRSLGGAAHAPGHPNAALPQAPPLRSVQAHEGGCFGLAFNRDGSLLASCGADKAVRLWELVTCSQTARLAGAMEGLNDVCFTSDSKLVLGADNRQAVRVWDVVSGRLKQALTGHTGKVVSLDCSHTDPGAVVSCAADRTIKVWGLDRGFCVSTLMCHSTCNSVALTLDGNTIVSGHFDGTLRFWDLRSGRQAHEVAGLHSQPITSVAAGLSGGLVLTCGKDNLLRAVDVRSFEVRATLSAPNRFVVGGAWCTACLSPNEALASAGSADGSVFVWDVAMRAVVCQLREGRGGSGSGGGTPRGNSGGGGGGTVVACGWSPAGLPLVSCTKEGAVTFWGNRAA